MWIFTRDGFFSIAATRFCQPGEVAVRARKIEHLERMMARHDVTADILTFSESDYRYRIQIPRETFARILAEEALSLDYNSFKDAMAESEASADYLRVMFATWAAVHKMQSQELPRD
ncbi:hypothetical protein NNJEOMEG_02526 [Fundidesulfovibrio magnetotacticus]|uniref:Uncharacterized protein n=1 Tax=Fundidesulfovibrio magnetotacticus TaxID=2730080 RepID=A0A6V8LX76_9BACT|nr:hypothetical protein [Fundidesulfovibrio magnetotacticus]GFK94679.1 hypothetical protein NNJEOMEG_02526 [Fundidesulfovibrio magnetotacticus]